MSEAAQAITEAKIKVQDVDFIVELASKFHLTYAEFAPSLLENLKPRLLPTGADFNMSRLRVDLRLFADLITVGASFHFIQACEDQKYTVGILPQKDGLAALFGALKVLVQKDMTEHKFISVVTTFCRYCGDDYMSTTGGYALKKAAEKQVCMIDLSTNKSLSFSGCELA